MANLTCIEHELCAKYSSVYFRDGNTEIKKHWSCLIICLIFGQVDIYSLIW